MFAHPPDVNLTLLTYFDTRASTSCAPFLDSFLRSRLAMIAPLRLLFLVLRTIDHQRFDCLFDAYGFVNPGKSAASRVP